MTKQAQHTRGRWKVGTSSGNRIACVDAVDRRGGKTEICEVWGEKDDKTITPQSLANARLIAEAPAMLEALRQIDELLTEWPTMRALSAYGAKNAMERKRRAQLLIGPILARIDGEVSR